MIHWVSIAVGCFVGYVILQVMLNQEKMIRGLQERNDRLVEAITHKAGESVYMPHPQRELIPSSRPEKSEGWFDVRDPVHPRPPQRRES